MEAAGVELEITGAANQLMARDFCCNALSSRHLETSSESSHFPTVSRQSSRFVEAFWRRRDKVPAAFP
jgi:hypothetical protein